MTGPRFCVQCGHELKPDLRFCVACGHAVSEATPTMPAFAREDVAPAPPSVEPTWPSKGSYQPAPPLDDFSRPTAPPVPAPEDFSRRSHQFSPPPGRPRSRRPLVGLLTVLLPAAVAATVAYFLIAPSHAANPNASTTQIGAGNKGTAQASAASPSVSTSPSPSPTPTQVSEQQAATNLAALLSQSVKDRSSITAAVNDVNSCGSTLSHDSQTFQNAAASRQQLLSQLAGLSGRSALPAAMLQSLTGAWQASAAADQDLGKWAQDEVSKGCTPSDQADANFQAAEGPDGQATTDKKAFVGQWNSIATQYGLTKYQWNQL
jgi:hypothetical protein